MIRRRFLGLMALTGAGGLAVLSAKTFAERRSVTYIVQGFTCVTCATGLETLLQRESGVLAARASYPDGLTTVSYDAKRISPPEIQHAIESMGFRAQLHPAPGIEASDSHVL